MASVLTMYEGMAADEQPDKINEGKSPMQVISDAGVSALLLLLSLLLLQVCPVLLITITFNSPALIGARVRSCKHSAFVVLIALCVFPGGA